MKTLIFCNQKGGVGKTLSAQSVGACLHRKGFKVLMIDTDPQGHLSKASGVIPDENDATTYEVLKGTAKISDAIQTAPGGYSIVPTDIRQTGAEIELAGTPGRDFLLKEALAEVSGAYDFAVIDSPPSLSIVTLMGLTAADGVIITLKSDYLGLDGVAQLKDTIDLVRRRLNPKLKITGVVLTFYNPRANLARQIAEQAEEGFPGKVFDTKISRNIALEESPATGGDIFDYKPKSKPAEQYAALTDEIIARTK